MSHKDWDVQRPNICYIWIMKKNNWGDKKIMHVYNRGVDKRQVFMDQLDVWRFMEALSFFNSSERTEFFEFINPDKGLVRNKKIKLGCPTSQLVKIHAYCLCINHFHLIVEEVQGGGMSLFMKKMGGYTKYFNQRYNRTGALFAGNYKRRLIETDADLQNVSAYVHKNYFVHNISDMKLVRSSYQEIFELKNDQSLVETHENGGFNSLGQWKKYIDSTVIDIKHRREELEIEKRSLYLE